MNRSLRRSGSALLLALIAFLFMAGIGGAIFTLTLTGQTTTMAASAGDGAYHIAEAGIDDAVNKMRAYLLNPKLDTADFAVIGVTVTVDGEQVNQVTGSIRGGTYSATISPPVDQTPGQVYTIESIGELTGVRRGVRTYVKSRNFNQNPNTGLFGEVYLDTGGNIKTDGYKAIDVATGAKISYLSQITGNVGGVDVALKEGHVGSNGNVDVSGSSMIYGNATPGPDSTVTGGGAVYGSSAPAEDYYTLNPPDFSVPAGVTQGSAVTGNATFGSAGADTTVWVPSVSPNGKSEVTIKGNVTMYVDGDFVFAGQPILNIEPGATLTVYQNSASGTAKFNVAGGSVVNQDQLPSSLTLYSNTKTGKLTGNSDFFGTIYAPTTEMAILGTAGLFGSTVAKSIDVQGTPFFHYDVTLGANANYVIKVDVKAIEQFVPGTASTSK